MQPFFATQCSSSTQEATSKGGGGGGDSGILATWRCGNVGGLKLAFGVSFGQKFSGGVFRVEGVWQGLFWGIFFAEKNRHLLVTLWAVGRFWVQFYASVISTDAHSPAKFPTAADKRAVQLPHGTVKK